MRLEPATLGSQLGLHPRTRLDNRPNLTDYHASTFQCRLRICATTSTSRRTTATMALPEFGAQLKAVRIREVSEREREVWGTCGGRGVGRRVCDRGQRSGLAGGAALGHPDAGAGHACHGRAGRRNGRKRHGVRLHDEPAAGPGPARLRRRAQGGGISPNGRSSRVVPVPEQRRRRTGDQLRLKRPADRDRRSCATARFHPHARSACRTQREPRVGRGASAGSASRASCLGVERGRRKRQRRGQGARRRERRRQRVWPWEQPRKWKRPRKRCRKRERPGER